MDTCPVMDWTRVAHAWSEFRSLVSGDKVGEDHKKRQEHAGWIVLRWICTEQAL